MRRVLIAGARGVFGALIRSRLAERGIAAETLPLDVEDRVALTATVREGDVIVDAAGPFQRRTTTLAEVAIGAGADLIDIADALGYVERVLSLAQAAARSRTRILTACSAVAAVAAACVRVSGIERPERVDIFLAPAARVTAGGATAWSFISSIGTPIRVFADGSLRPAVGWRGSHQFPVGRRRGHEVESAAAALLPRAWPSLRDVRFWVDPNVPLAGVFLGALAQVAAARPLARFAFPLARLLGSRRGVFAVRTEGGGRSSSVILEGERRSQVIAAEPAVIAVEALLSGSDEPAGVVPVDRQVTPSVLFARLRDLGVEVRSA